MYGNAKERTSITPEKRTVLLLLAAGADNDSRDQYLYSSNVSCSDVYAWLKHAVWIWLMYLAVQWGFAWILGRFIIRKVEGKDE